MATSLIAGLFFVVGMVRCVQQTGASPSRLAAAGGCLGDRSLDFDLWRGRGDGVDELQRRAKETTGISIRFDPPHADLSDFYRNHHYVPLDEEKEQELAILHVQQQLRRYGDLRLAELLNHIVVVERIWYDELPIGGYASPGERLLFVTREGLLERDSLHHEIGHVVDYGWFRWAWSEDWIALNGEGWSYPCPRDPGCRLRAPYFRGHAEAGFVSSYGSTAFAEDFAELFEMHLECPQQLTALAEKHGERFEPADIIRTHAKSENKFR